MTPYRPLRRHCLTTLSALPLLLACAAARTEPFPALDALVFQPFADPPVAQEAPPESAEIAPLGDLEASLAHADLERQRSRIASLEHEEGPWSESLMEVLLSLGRLYQQLDEHSLALAAFERAEHVGRIHYGLHSPRLIPAVEQSIDSLVALGQLERADDRHEYLLYLARKCFGAQGLEVLPALLRLADWNLALYRQAMGLEPEGSVRVVPPFTTPRERLQLARVRLYGAQKAYLDAINVLVHHQAYDDPRLLRLERRLVDTHFQQAFQEDILYEEAAFLETALRRPDRIGLDEREAARDRAFRNGLASYRRMLAYLEHSGGSAADYLEVLLERGDWHFLFGRQAGGMQHYEEAERFLTGLHFDETARAELLAPAVPVVMPVFDDALPQSLAAGAAHLDDAGGYVDVSFRLDRNGRARKVDVTGASEGTPAAVESRLLRLLRQARFRPQVEDGQAREAAFTLRYYYSENS